MTSRRVANIIRRLQELPGQELFVYRDSEGDVREIDSGDINTYLHDIAHESITAKDFRTWIANVTAAEALVAIGDATSATTAKRNINVAIGEASSRLGNTRTVCRASYIYPAVVTAYADGWLAPVWKEGYVAETPEGLRPEEMALPTVLCEIESRIEKQLPAQG